MRLKSVELVNALSAAFEQLQVLTQTSVNINQNVIKAEQGEFLLFAKYFDKINAEDGAGASDGAVLGYFKSITGDNATLADNATNAFLKVAKDYGYVTDVEVLSFIKGAFEEILLADQIDTKAFGKPLADGSSVSDDPAKTFARPASDAFSVSDDDTLSVGLNKADPTSASDLYEMAYAKPQADAFAVSEESYNTVGKFLFDGVTAVGDYVVLFTKKAPNETVGALDALRMDLARTLAETPSISEAHSLEPGKVLQDQIAGVGDQTLLFAKKVAEHFVSMADNDTLAFAKALVDNGFVSEAIDTLTYGKNVADAAGFADQINTKGTTKQLADTVTFTDDVDGAASILDDQEMQFTKITTDVSAVSEVFYRQVAFVRAFADTGALSDLINTRAVGKRLSETPSASDSTNVLTGKHLYDIPVVSETLAKSFARGRSDSALLGDAKVVTAGKVLLDLASTADAGSLRSQGYSDFTYFAEDFVGASRTF